MHCADSIHYNTISSVTYMGTRVTQDTCRLIIGEKVLKIRFHRRFCIRCSEEPTATRQLVTNEADLEVTALKALYRTRQTTELI